MPGDRYRERRYSPTHSGPRGGYSYHGGSEREVYSSRQYITPYTGPASGSSYNYWQDYSTTQTPVMNGDMRDDGVDDSNSRYNESTYSGQYHDSRSRSARGSGTGLSPVQYPWRQHYSTLQTPSQTQPFLVPPTSRFGSPPPTEAVTPTTCPSPLDQSKATPPPPPPPPTPDPNTPPPDLIPQEAPNCVPYNHAWLDTMVWSSAQPHSVEDMVNKVFGSYQDDLRAVWSRRSLGLSVEEYHRKTATTKDLTKPWKLLPLDDSAGAPLSGSPAPAELEESHIIHSALVTLLLDDTPRKALLQPYNHVCIPEYDSPRRQRDLQSLNTMEGPKEGKRSKKRRLRDEVDAAAVDHVDPASPRPDTDLIISDSLPSASLASLYLTAEPFDVTLLSAIGVLDAIKLQSNVAAWIRGGGLWHTIEKSVEVGAVLDVEELSERAVQAGLGKPDIRDDNMDTTSVVQPGNDASTTTELQATMWFNDPSTLAYWVGRGRNALNELGIEVSHGVTG
ncbi:hypothetical protein BU15DRAFT_68384 [Melanogaster broomeanus]|nr:hypothetical protein BU15DRAFT_68384 [Melanogaster broomeanus]